MMSATNHQWGCCSLDNVENDDLSINCVKCSKSFHFCCLSIPVIEKNSDEYSIWECPECLKLIPKLAREDCTPIRNVSTTRGNKRPALNSPPEMRAVTADEVRVIVEDVVKVQCAAILQEFRNMVMSLINTELEPIKKEMQELKESFTFHTVKFDELQAEHIKNTHSVKHLSDENVQLRSTISDLNQKLNYFEQQSRANNLEVQCIPEHKQENLYTVTKQLGSVVGCELKDSDILHVTRIAKLNNTNPRPRSVVVQLASPRMRDQLLAAVMGYNKKNKENKLNSSDLGIGGDQVPVYVVEHLSAANKALHAATRIKAKEKGYRYVWVRYGRIYVKKDDDADHLLIKSLNTLNKLV